MAANSHPSDTIEMVTVTPKQSTSDQSDEGATQTATTIREDFTKDEIPVYLQDDCLVKFFRCRYAERDRFLHQLNEETDGKRVKRELDRIEKLRSVFFETKENQRLVNKYKKLRAEWKNHARDNSHAQSRDIRKRVRDMGKLRDEDRMRRENLERDILQEVKKWERTQLPPPRPQRRKPPPHPVAPEHPDRFHRLLAQMNAQMKKRGPNFYSHADSNVNVHDDDDSNEESEIDSAELGPNAEERSRRTDSYGISVSQITLTKNKASVDEDSSSFTDYHIIRHKLSDVLYETKNNPLRRNTANTDEIRYFHFPSNNMHWIEEAIARYYGEDSGGEFNYRKHAAYRKMSSNFLCREYWTSLQHGSQYDPVHARHMRAHCSFIRTEPEGRDAKSKTNKNFVLFMPYLHWETHRRRKQMAKVIEQVTRKHRGGRSHATEIMTDEFKDATDLIVNGRADSEPIISELKRQKEADAAKNTKKAKKAQRKKEARIKKVNRKEEEHPVKAATGVTPWGPLGEYLIQISKVYEAMDIEPDVRMLRDYLHEEPPMHSRRTLDQSYYWKLANTDKRDEDQVVYRATRQGKNISRTTRVVMVDQLWLYILDENTIITSFPRRWGRNKPDYSGVHKGIRAILNQLGEKDIQSVYDLALLIVNQCSTVFFDRTKPVDERPELLEIFSNALSNISGMKTVAFETFWRHLTELNKADHSFQNFEEAARKHLNINPEGKLLKEVHDIIEELRMMERIYTQQQNVVQRFKEQLHNLHEQERKETLKMQPDDTHLNVLVEIKNLLGQQFREGGNSRQVDVPRDLNNKTIFSPGFHVNKNVESTITENTLLNANRVAEDIELRKGELRELEESTSSVYEQLKDLLSLKQQQASIIEAKHALKRADESVTQGRSVMLFTIVTIIFLPLSFMTSVFGMNASDFDAPDGNGNKMTLRHQFKLLFPISFGVIFISLLFAFSSWIRSVLLFCISVSWAAVTEYTGIRWLLSILAKGYTPDKVWVAQKERTQKIYGRRKRHELEGYQHKAEMIEKMSNKTAKPAPATRYMNGARADIYIASAV